MSKTYDLFAGIFESKYREMTLKYLNIKTGEKVLEIGFGTGHSLKKMAMLVGDSGNIYGIDISSGMLKVAAKRLSAADLMGRVTLTCGDAAKLPYEDSKFDTVFMSFTLELFDTPEISLVLKEIRRVLKPNGKLGIVSMSKGNGSPVMVKLYEFIHRKFPTYADCRPIYVEQSIRDAGFEISFRETLKLSGLPIEIVITESK